ncbi:MAG TPA: HAMP domain-containing sensor histidine kinase [Vicinamibacterales bacterium]|nr:HAMP domain-containing sensor histidine kinase [Vicinamibacterales bacterium]
MHNGVSNWPRLLSLAVHEFRTPVTVVAGYLRMLLRDRAGPLAPNQRRLLEEAEKSCGRLSALISEMSELGQLHDGRQSLSEGTAELGAILQEIGRTPACEGQAGIVIDESSEPLPVTGDAARLRRTIEAIVFALRREIIDGSDLVIAAASRAKNGARVAWIALGTASIAAALKEASADSLGPFDEWRGGCGLSLPLARRVVEMHGGRLLALPGERQKSGGVIELPLS